MKKILFVLILTGIFSAESQAQVTRYLVKFKDKNGTPYSFSNPLAYLSQRAIDRRTRYGIALDSTDLPCTPSYVNQVKNVPNVTLLNVSKWLNSVTILTSDPNAITTINGFSFVQSTSGIASRIISQQEDEHRSKFETDFSPIDNQTGRTDQILSDFYNYGVNAFTEIHLHNGEFLHNIGLRGQTMQIAMLDAGFFHYTTLPAFDSANLNGQILSTWDFVSREQSVIEDDSHGMSCLSTIVSNIPGQFVGTAPKSSFYLFRTEDNTPNQEYPIEEHNWSCGAERADSTGADIISTSLGYTTFLSPLTSSDHSYSDMNGNTTMAAIAADLAAKKGILVFAAIGNDGSGTWHYLGTPSDGDSVIAVGAVSQTNVIASFSSWGPSSDGQVKPDLLSVGAPGVIENSSGNVTLGSGTSFATPKMAGLGTCLWQGFPEFNNMKIRSALWAAGDSATTPGNHRGYGLPNVKKAFTSLLTDFATSSSSLSGCRVTVNWTSKDVRAMNYEIEKKAPTDLNYSLIGTVNPQTGTILAIHSYQFINDLTSGSTGVYSYRIRQIVDTAAATFTAVYVDTTNITVSSPCIVTGITPIDPNSKRITIIPNPAFEHFTLKIETANPINDLNIQILDMKGRLVLKFNRSKPAGVANFDLPISRLAKGKYIVSVYEGSQLIASKELIKL
jgi:serine protease AprX